MLLAEKAIVAAKTATTEEELNQAQILATAAEESSGAVVNALQVNNLAAQAITEQNTEKTEALTKTAETAAESVKAVDSAVDEIDQAFEDKDSSGMDDAINNLNDAKSASPS